MRINKNPQNISQDYFVKASSYRQCVGLSSKLKMDYSSCNVKLMKSKGY